MALYLVTGEPWYSHSELMEPKSDTQPSYWLRHFTVIAIVCLSVHLTSSAYRCQPSLKIIHYMHLKSFYIIILGIGSCFAEIEAPAE